MTHNEEFLYKKIRRHEAQIAYLMSRTGTIVVAIGESAGGGIYEGFDDPNAVGLIPAPANKPALYNRFNPDHTPKEQLWWHVASQTWL